MRRLIDDPEQCYRFMKSRDTRFDGQFYVAVTSTGIYCRPSCPARLPRYENCRFFPSAAAALGAGFRACKRCRPNVSPGSPEWVLRADLAARAVRLIADGVVDRGGVAALATRLGYSTRQVHRTLTAELGAGPLALARAQRAQASRVLVESTELPMADVAFAAGFDSVRQFNATVREVFALTPTELRRRARPGGQHRGQHGPSPDARPGVRTGVRPGVRTETGAGSATAAATVRLRLAVRTPFQVDSLFGHLAATAVPGVEEWRDGAYHRSLVLEHGPAVVELRPGGAGSHVAVTLRLTDHRDLASAVARCRWLLDLDADPEAVDAALAEDPLLRDAVHAAPGRRVPRCVDGGELALRIVLGQQVSTAAARTVTGRLAAVLGTPLPAALLAGGGTVARTFPSVAAVAAADPAELPLPRRRATTLVTLASALAAGDLDLSPGADREAALDALGRLPGIGPWTVSSVAMRALGDPDAFLPSDLGVVAAGRLLGLTTSREVLARSERWRPWRSYATQVLWGLLDHPINRLPAEPPRPDRDPDRDRDRDRGQGRSRGSEPWRPIPASEPPGHRGGWREQPQAASRHRPPARPPARARA